MDKFKYSTMNDKNSLALDTFNIGIELPLSDILFSATVWFLAFLFLVICQSFFPQTWQITDCSDFLFHFRIFRRNIYPFILHIGLQIFHRIATPIFYLMDEKYQSTMNNFTTLCGWFLVIGLIIFSIICIRVHDETYKFKA